MKGKMDKIDETLKKLKEVKDYLTRNQDILRRAYGNKYIAVRGDVVIGSHVDRPYLVRDMNSKFGDYDFLVATIDGIIDPSVYENPYIEVKAK